MLTRISQYAFFLLYDIMVGKMGIFMGDAEHLSSDSPFGGETSLWIKE